MTSKGGCGCGGTATQTFAGRAGGEGCGCGSVTASMSGAYVRPRFFAGQLLTEDDLELLGEYVVAKNRLHNCSFIGDGVVCGLEVSCHPCGDGRVVVRPGHALDCCGNDIVVPCEAELDLNAMIHRLRVDVLGGYDCGDPCEQPAKPQAVAEGGEEGEGKVEILPPAARRYSLYVKYAEEPTEPVAPYATGEPCGDEGCQPSRIREGHAFELRCPVDRPEPDDFIVRAIGCVDDLFGSRVARRRSLWDVTGGRIPNALRGTAGKPLPYTNEDATALKSSTAALRAFVQSQEKAAKAGAAVEPADVRRSLDELRVAVMTATRLNALPEEDRRVAFARSSSLADAFEKAPEALRAAAAAVAPHIERAVEDDVDRALARALVEEGPRLAEKGVVAGAPQDIRAQLAMEGAPVTRASMRVLQRSLADIKEWLLSRLDKSTFLTDCALRQDVERIVVPPPTEAEVDKEQVSQAGTAGEALAAALVRYVYGCVCAALLPPCSDCDDTAVLLATVEVDQCKVTHVCNLERRIPLTPTALRYWLPIEHLARLLDKTCCGTPRERLQKKPLPSKPPEEAPEVALRRRAQPQERVFARPADEPSILATTTSLLRTAGLPVEQTERVSRAVRDVAQLDLRELIAPLAASMPVAPAPAPVTVGEVESVAERVAAEAVARATKAMEAERAKEAKDAAATTAALKEVRNQVRGLRTRAEGLKRANDEIAKKNRELERRNDDLDKRVTTLQGSRS